MKCDICGHKVDPHIGLTASAATDSLYACSDCCSELGVRILRVINYGNEIRERWEAAQKEKARERLARFLEEKKANGSKSK